MAGLVGRNEIGGLRPNHLSKTQLPSSLSAGRRQGDVDERYSAPVDRDSIGLGSHRSVA
jgi:hypothetical protein